MRLTEFCDRFGVMFDRSETINIRDLDVTDLDMEGWEWKRFLKDHFPNNDSVRRVYEHS